METRQFGRYKILSEVGRGGMAAVYRALDPAFDREVALKVLPAEMLHDPSFRARFQREARIVAALEHAAIVPVHDFGEEDGQPFFVMRLMSGGSLVERLRRGPLPIEEATRILAAIAPALDEAHARGVIHRDLKPGNILFDQHDNPYLSDFGIAKLAESGATLTASYAIIGTPAYMSPEQARGEKDIDGRSDVYSLGAILFEMLCGRVPYEAETPTGQIVKHITEPVPNILELRPDLPYTCQMVIEGAMAKDRTSRYATATELSQALKGVAPPPVTAPPLAERRPTLSPSGAPPSSAPPPRGTPLPYGAPPHYATPPPPASASFTRPRRGVSIAACGIGGFLFFACLSALLLIIAPQLLNIRLVGSTATPPPSATLTSQPVETPPPTETASPMVPPSQTSAATPTPPAAILPTATVTAYVATEFASLRSGPGPSYAVLATYRQNTLLLVLGRNQDASWLKVQESGRAQQGWMAANALNVSVLDLQTLPVVP